MFLSVEKKLHVFVSLSVQWWIFNSLNSVSHVHVIKAVPDASLPEISHLMIHFSACIPYHRYDCNHLFGHSFSGYSLECSSVHKILDIPTIFNNVVPLTVQNIGHLPSWHMNKTLFEFGHVIAQSQ